MSELDRRGSSRHEARSSRHKIPQWAEPQDELDDQIHEWIDAGAQAQLSEEIQPQDSVSLRGQEPAPMEQQNQGATK